MGGGSRSRQLHGKRCCRALAVPGTPYTFTLDWAPPAMRAHLPLQARLHLFQQRVPQRVQALHGRAQQLAVLR